ncbi:MAG TPA: carbohydrate deacetylase [Anaerolineae bacterium]|nr:carbohydrate deacetylase [Anaerolineae bacterium]
MPKQLIVNADDFGRTHQVSAGILQAHREGIVTSATAMMNMPGAAQDLSAALVEAPQLGLGVHLVFTAGRPLLPPEWAPSLIDARGHFHTQAAILEDPSRLDPDELRAEFKAQISAFEHATGRRPDHIDCHHFAHVHSQLFAVYHDVALEFNLPLRVPFPRRESDLSDAGQMPGMAALIPAETIKAIIRVNWQRLAEQPVRAPDRFIVGFFAANVSIEYLLNLLDRLPDGVSELMTHPGFSDETLSAESAYNAQREVELAVLTDPRVRQRVADLGIELTTYDVLRAA